MTSRSTTALFLCAGFALVACNPVESDWAKATAANTAGAYQTFIRDHPDSKHAQEARGRVFALHDDQVWAAAKATNTIASFQEYLHEEPGGTHVGEAHYQTTALQRAAAWEAAQNDGSPAALNAFLNKYPQGPEANDARRKLGALSYRAELSDAGSKTAAERMRAGLQARFSKEVHDLVVVPPAAPDTRYRVTSGPMSQSDANAVCAAVERRHQGCKLLQIPETPPG